MGGGLVIELGFNPGLLPQVTDQGFYPGQVLSIEYCRYMYTCTFVLHIWNFMTAVDQAVTEGLDYEIVCVLTLLSDILL
jgi:hypothetical protein